MPGIFDPDERVGIVEPTTGPDEVRDVRQVRLLGEIAPPGLVVLLRGQQLRPDALRTVAPRTVVTGIVIQCPDVPLFNDVTLAGVVVHAVLQEIVIPHIAPKGIHNVLLDTCEK